MDYIYGKDIKINIKVGDLTMKRNLKIGLLITAMGVMLITVGTSQRIKLDKVPYVGIEGLKDQIIIDNSNNVLAIIDSSGNTSGTATNASGNSAPVVTVRPLGGQIEKGTDTKIQISAVDSDGDGIAYFAYYWDVGTPNAFGNYVRFAASEYKSDKATLIPIPQTEGVHILRVQAADQNGNLSQVYNMAFNIVTTLTNVSQNHKPTFDFSTMPAISINNNYILLWNPVS